MQILRKHIRPLLGLRGAPATKLTLRQRLAYLAGGVQWFNEVLGGLFTALLLVTAVGSALGGRLGLPALSGAALVVPPLLILTGVVRSQWGLRRTAGCSRRQAARAHLVWFALSWVVARACISALVRRAGCFLRTPKTRGARAWQRAVRASAAESALALGCVGGAIALGLRHADSLAAMLAALLVMQAGLYASAPLCGLWAEGIQLTPARRLYAASAQNTGEWPAAPRVILRLGAAASLAAGTAAVASIAVAAPTVGTPLFLAPDLVGPALGTVHIHRGTASTATPPPTPSPSASDSPSPGAPSGSPMPTPAGGGAAPAASPSPSPAPSSTPAAAPSSSPSSAPAASATPRPAGPTASAAAGQPSPSPTAH